MTPLSKPIKRELTVAGERYVLTVDPDGLKLARKGRRKGYALQWQDLVSGDAALATALTASLRAVDDPVPAPPVAQTSRSAGHDPKRG